VIQHGALAFGHRIEALCQERDLAAVVPRDLLPVIGQIIVRTGMVRLADVEEGIEQT